MEPQERCVHLDKLQTEGTSVRSRASRDKERARDHSGQPHSNILSEPESKGRKLTSVSDKKK
jgi:hypothetical protein